MRYISELEHKVQTLQTEATTLSAQLTLLQVRVRFYLPGLVNSYLLRRIIPQRLPFFAMQRDSSGLTSQNSELKFRLQAMEQQAQLRDGTRFVVLFC